MTDDEIRDARIRLLFEQLDSIEIRIRSEEESLAAASKPGSPYTEYRETRLTQLRVERAQVRRELVAFTFGMPVR